MDQEKPENLKENSDSSHSRTSSPIDDITLDPNFKCRVTDVEPRSISTRQRRISEDTDIDSTSLFNPIYKTQTIVLQLWIPLLYPKLQHQNPCLQLLLG